MKPGASTSMPSRARRRSIKASATSRLVRFRKDSPLAHAGVPDCSRLIPPHDACVTRLGSPIGLFAGLKVSSVPIHWEGSTPPRVFLGSMGTFQQKSLVWAETARYGGYGEQRGCSRAAPADFESCSLLTCFVPLASRPHAPLSTICQAVCPISTRPRHVACSTSEIGSILTRCRGTGGTKHRD